MDTVGRIPPHSDAIADIDYLGQAL